MKGETMKCGGIGWGTGVLFTLGYQIATPNDPLWWWEVLLDIPLWPLMLGLAIGG